MIERLQVWIPVEAAAEFSSPESTLRATLIRCPFHPHDTTVACKRPRSLCKKCRWQVTPKHAYTLDPSQLEWADYAAVHAECGNLSGNELTRNSSWHTRLRSSQLAEPLWTDPGLISEISLRKLISTFKKKAQAENGQTFSPNLHMRGKGHQHHLFLFKWSRWEPSQTYLGTGKGHLTLILAHPLIHG